MRALTFDELRFVAGGDGPEPKVPAPNPDPCRPQREAFESIRDEMYKRGTGLATLVAATAWAKCQSTTGGDGDSGSNNNNPTGKPGTPPPPAGNGGQMPQPSDPPGGGCTWDKGTFTMNCSQG